MNNTKEALRILFIGNSHTYYNDMPCMVARRCAEEGYDCAVTMLAHGGWFLDQHVEEPDVRFNILYGKYDYVVLQEHSHPFGPEEKFFHAANILNQWIREAGSTPLIYMTWAKKDEEPEQARMTQIHKAVAKEIDALLAPVGENWWDYLHSHPELEMYDPDGAHASRHGSEFAAKYIWDAIRADLLNKEKTTSQYLVLRIDEDINYGCEERAADEPVMAIVTLQDKDGNQCVLRQKDQMLYDLNINEGDYVTIDKQQGDQTIQKLQSVH